MNEKPIFKAGDYIVYDDTLFKVNDIEQEGILQSYEVDFVAGKAEYVNIWSIPIQRQTTFQKYDRQKYPLKHFYPFCKVLVREFDINQWKCDFFSHISQEGMFVTTSGKYMQCIPYETNKELIGTSKDAHEYYTRW